jgi:peptidyl-dipeptidase A
MTGVPPILIAVALSVLLAACSRGPAEEARQFLEVYTPLAQKLQTVSAEANWKAATDVNDQHTGERIGADRAYAVFGGSEWVINTSRGLLQRRGSLDDLTARQLDKILLEAAEFPGTLPGIVEARVAQEADQSKVLDGFEFCYDRAGAKCVKTITPNQIDEILVTSHDLAERRKTWEVSKQTGPALKAGLVKLRDLRNKVAQELGYSSFFHLQVADYGMTVAEMMQLMESFNRDLQPLYEQVHTWTKHRLASRYKQPVPEKIPAHWIGNRWAQSWPGLVESANLDELFRGKTPEWIVQQSERFYTSLGMPSLPASFWEKSDLYALPPGATRKKNTHASAWHIDGEKDVRSLMSVEPNHRWFVTAHHELGHIYYYLAYSNPQVPFMLRGGANRAFHEAVGDLLGIAAGQVPYLRQIGVLPEDRPIDQTQWLLAEVLDEAVFIPFSAGTMSGWEHDLYEKDLTPEEFNRRWWEYAGRYQGIEPPAPRGEEYCDACTKTHVNDDPAQYYDYAMAYVIKYQLHDYIARNILKQDPRNCNYYGNQEVGRFLWDLLSLGATRDWRQVIREKTGEDISTRAMRDYFQPVMIFLEKENAGRKIGWQ